MRKLNIALIVAATIACSLVPVHSAIAATGANPVLDSPAFSGNLYVPLTPASSGPLTLGGMGTTPSSVALSGNGASSEGWVSYSLYFDLSGEISPQTPSVIMGCLMLEFSDLDFRETMVDGVWEYSESLQIAFAGNTPLTLDSTNYENYAEGVPPIQTDNHSVMYCFDLEHDLGVTAGQFAQLSQNMGFSVNLIWRSHVTHLGAGTDTLFNPPGSVGMNNFTFLAVPEPASVAMVMLGGLALLRRRSA